MLKLSLFSLWARRRRLMSTGLAVVLGVAFLTGTLVLGDTLKANFDRLFTEVSAGTSVVVRNVDRHQERGGPREQPRPHQRVAASGPSGAWTASRPPRARSSATDRSSAATVRPSAATGRRAWPAAGSPSRS